MGPLSGLTIIEMAGLGPCPFAGQMFADLGADVIVIDRSAGKDHSVDVNRRGKRSLCINLKSERGRAIMLRLASKADALIEGFRPGVMERLALGPQDLATVNPRLVYGRMTGWGQDGPLAQRAGHDITYLAVTGALHAMGEPGRPPVPPLNLVADYGGGSMFLLAGVLAALIARGKSGKGQTVDAAMVDGVPAMMGLVHSLLANGIWTGQRGNNLLDGAAPFYRCYPTSDRRFVAVGALEPQFFAILAEVTGIDPAYKRTQMDKRRWPQMAQALADAFVQRTRDEWVQIFQSSDGCVAPVLDFDEAAAFGHNRQRNVFHEIGGVIQAAPAPRFSNSNCELPRPGGKSGGDSEAVLLECQFSPAEIESLRADGTLT